MGNEDMPTTCLTQITEALEKHSGILADHRRYLEKLFEELTAVKKKVENLEANPIDSSDVEFLKSVSARLKAISTKIDAQH